AVDDARIQPQAGIVDENPAVDLSDIDLRYPARDENLRGLFQIQGNAEILGEMIERAEREYAQPLSGLGEHGGDGIDRAVTAPRRYRIRIFAQGMPRQIGNLIAAVRDPNPNIPVA